MFLVNGFFSFCNFCYNTLIKLTTTSKKTDTVAKEAIPPGTDSPPTGHNYSKRPPDGKTSDKAETAAMRAFSPNRLSVGSFADLLKEQQLTQTPEHASPIQQASINIQDCKLLLERLNQTITIRTKRADPNPDKSETEYFQAFSKQLTQLINKSELTKSKEAIENFKKKLETLQIIPESPVQHVLNRFQSKDHPSYLSNDEKIAIITIQSNRAEQKFEPIQPQQSESSADHTEL